MTIRPLPLGRDLRDPQAAAALAELRPYYSFRIVRLPQARKMRKWLAKRSLLSSIEPLARGRAEIRLLGPTSWTQEQADKAMQGAFEATGND